MRIPPKRSLDGAPRWLGWPAASSLRKQFGHDRWRSLEGRIDLALVFAAGLGDVGLAAARTTDKFGHGTHQLSGLDAPGQAGQRVPRL